MLVNDGWLPFKRKYFAGNNELSEQAGDFNRQVDSGLADYDEFIHKVAIMAHITDEEARNQIEDNLADPELFEYIARELKPKYKIGMLSNAGANWLSEMLSPEQVALFDAIVLSYETGITKPDARAYKLIADQLGVQSENCVFIDDQERYATAAGDVGMQSIWYRNFEQAKADLETILAK